MEYYSAIKCMTYYNTDEPWKHYATWRQPVTKDRTSPVPFTWRVQNRQIRRDRKRLPRAGSSGWNGKWLPAGWSFFLGRWKFQKSTVAMMHRLNTLKPTKLYTLKGCIVWLVNFISKLFLKMRRWSIYFSYNFRISALVVRVQQSNYLALVFFQGWYLVSFSIVSTVYLRCLCLC